MPGWEREEERSLPAAAAPVLRPAVDPARRPVTAPACSPTATASAVEKRDERRQPWEEGPKGEEREREGGKRGMGKNGRGVRIICGSHMLTQLDRPS